MSEVWTTPWCKDDNWCAWEKEEYGTCIHDLALADEALPFRLRLWAYIKARWFFFRLRFEEGLEG